MMTTTMMSEAAHREKTDALTQGSSSASRARPSPPPPEIPGRSPCPPLGGRRRWPGGWPWTRRRRSGAARPPPAAPGAGRVWRLWCGEEEEEEGGAARDQLAWSRRRQLSQSLLLRPQRELMQHFQDLRPLVGPPAAPSLQFPPSPSPTPPTRRLPPPNPHHDPTISDPNPNPRTKLGVLVLEAEGAVRHDEHVAVRQDHRHVRVGVLPRPRRERVVVHKRGVHVGEVGERHLCGWGVGEGRWIGQSVRPSIRQTGSVICVCVRVLWSVNQSASGSKNWADPNTGRHTQAQRPNQPSNRPSKQVPTFPFSTRNSACFRDT